MAQSYRIEKFVSNDQKINHLSSREQASARARALQQDIVINHDKQELSPVMNLELSLAANIVNNKAAMPKPGINL